MKGDYYELQKHSLLNKFAFWLSGIDQKYLSNESLENLSSSSSGANSGDTGSSQRGFERRLGDLRQTLKQEYNDFVYDLKQELDRKISPESHNYYGWIEGPTDMLKLAEIFARSSAPKVMIFNSIYYLPHEGMGVYSK